MPISRLLDDDCPPFALLRRRTPGHDHDTIEVLIGAVHEAATLADIPAGDRPSLALIPFRQIRERGFDVRDDGTPLSVLVADESYELPLAEALERLPAHDVRVEGGAFDVDDEEYAGIVRRVIEDEIGQGEGANFVIRRTCTGRIPGFGKADALALFRRLLAGERGAYWTFVVHTGERTLVGASPEVHVRMSGGTVVMNPISGTYRYPPEGPAPETLLGFLDDRKEREELSMVVDEELKMMCTVGDMGGVVIGPRLKEMAHLAHTEYELRGRSSLDVREVLRETMFAATVTGSPVQNACRVIERHEVGGRGYYAGALALIGKDAGGAQTLDSPILIRTADIDADGSLRVPVGATLVRHSDPAGEVAETHAKAAGVLAALGVRPGRPREHAERPKLADDPRVRAALDARRADLAPFWLRMQERSAQLGPVRAIFEDQPAASDAVHRKAEDRSRTGRTWATPTTQRGAVAGVEGPTRSPGQGLSGHALVVDGEDTFTSMLAHLLRSSGLEVTVRRYDEPGLRETVRAHEGPVVLGPGPGDPADATDPKMRFLRALAADLLREHRHGLLGVCLGHELMAAELGLEIVRKDAPHQGAQERIDFFGREETVGFYNSFTARCDDAAAAELEAHGVEVARDPLSAEVHAMRGPGFAGIQFHAESVLTMRGPEVIHDLLAAATRVGRA
ncbi:phenazine-specific anthranilate synthase [Streptomyces lunaelactis]|uniref:anthranilate synthase family protein n=1 Tax=Streptomyces lunaelactis TaxID=1535768 RepID=UPI0015854C0C|nr:anthranilate synthase family protein [Streptomyces lunaelactis]NUK22938.1 phenazine-specific anthranilate synthase [Streptomyces lunaelactis]NUK49495.1 phenazine-specific anthranilate synthase [Streptomyces lunaelactis]NUK63774.1 phenazine-specific anthranilate synthase [Streptomyces lunaelactis]